MKLFEGFLRSKKEAIIQIILVIGILVTLNYLVSGFLMQFDLTDNKGYTLSKPSQTIAQSIKGPITVTAYFSGSLPPQLSRVQKQFRDLLGEFRRYSHGNLEYRFINPNNSPKIEKAAEHAGIQPVLVDVRKQDQISQEKAYLGAVFQYDGKTKAIPLIRPGTSLEYAIASAIHQLIIKRKPTIGILQGDGELTRSEMPQLMQELDLEYHVINVSGLDSTSVPADVDVLMVLVPRRRLFQNEQISIDQYIMSGGKVIFAIDKTLANRHNWYGFTQHLGVDKLLSSYHLPIDDNLVRDIRSSFMSVRQTTGGGNFVNRVRYPYYPVISNFGNNPITKGINAVEFTFTSSIDTSLVDTAQKVTVLAATSRHSGLATGIYLLKPYQKWTRSMFEKSHIPVAAMISGTFKSAFAGVHSSHIKERESVPTSLIVIGNGEFLDNGIGPNRHHLPQDNINFMVNCVDWLAGDTGLMAIRTKGITSRPLIIISSSAKSVLKYANVLLPIIVVLGYGFYRYEKHKSKRRKWMEEGININSAV